MASNKFQTYYQLTKPGIIYGNDLTAAAGFLLASQDHINLGLGLATLVGISLIIASACVVNNYIDRKIDKNMSRTKQRALVTGAIKPTAALSYATILGVVGFGLLISQTNWLTTLLGAIGYIDYIVFYGFTKRRSVYSTLVGSIAGATPIAAGYTAVSDHFNAGALILFLMLVFWQMPHFYSIAMYRYEDYKAAKLPVLSVKSSSFITKLNITGFTVGFIACSLLLSAYGYTGYIYAVAASLIGLAWLAQAVKGFSAPDDAAWARQMFKFSLLVITAFCVLIPLGSHLP